MKTAFSPTGSRLLYGTAGEHDRNTVRHMKKMLLQMTEAQLLMQVVLLVTDLVAEGMGQDIGMQTALILSLIPGALFCIFEFAVSIYSLIWRCFLKK